MCIKSYQANSSGELSLKKGDIVESKIRVIKNCKGGKMSFF